MKKSIKRRLVRNLIEDRVRRVAREQRRLARKSARHIPPPNAHAPLGSTLACGHCGKPFKKRHGPQVFCSKECRAANEKMKSGKWTKISEWKAKQGTPTFSATERLSQVRSIGSEDACLICSSPYVVRSHSQKYCPSCGERLQTREGRKALQERIDQELINSKLDIIMAEYGDLELGEIAKIVNGDEF
jgi:endogenous inhibitor of DNA gyrase (YacG/DUF329 family)